MSEHEVKIVEVGNILPHNNADSLEITNIDGWQVVIKKGSFKKGDKALYVEPDYVIPMSIPALCSIITLSPCLANDFTFAGTKPTLFSSLDISLGTPIIIFPS